MDFWHPFTFVGKVKYFQLRGFEIRWVWRQNPFGFPFSTICNSLGGNFASEYKRAFEISFWGPDVSVALLTTLGRELYRILTISSTNSTKYKDDSFPDCFHPPIEKALLFWIRNRSITYNRSIQPSRFYNFFITCN